VIDGRVEIDEYRSGFIFLAQPLVQKFVKGAIGEIGGVVHHNVPEVVILVESEAFIELP
jgi:hypothetical protein